VGFLREPRFEVVVGLVVALIALGFEFSPVRSFALAVVLWGIAGAVLLIAGINGWRRRGRTSGVSPTDSRVLVPYRKSNNERVSIQFRFPNEPNQEGPVMLAAGHGRKVLWHIAVTTDVFEAISDLRFNLVFPALLMRSLEAASADLFYSRHDLPDRLIADLEDKGALGLSGSFNATIPAGKWTTVLPFNIGLHYARELPVKVKLTSSTFGTAEYCAPIRAEIEPIRGTSPPERAERSSRLSALAMAAAGAGKPPPDVAVPAAREATDLIEKGKQLDEELWKRWKQIRRSGIPIQMLPAEFHDRVQHWNGDVVTLADRILSIKEQAQVDVYPVGVLRSYLAASDISKVIQSNITTLRAIRTRCQG
jgi:hypothetical protein